MKMHKIKLSAILVLTVLLCGCGRSDIPKDIYGQLSFISTTISGYISSARVKGEYADFADKCFSDIEVYGAKLVLPMNVSDLPEDFTIADNYGSGVMPYNGYNVSSVDLMCDGKKAAIADVMYPIGSKMTDGQIVSLSFDKLLFSPDANVAIGGESGYLSVNKVTELLGECEPNGNYMDLIYDLGNGRTITFSYIYTDCGAASVTLSTIGRWY